jgi:hypothetical protein
MVRLPAIYRRGLQGVHAKPDGIQDTPLAHLFQQLFNTL